MKHRINMAAGTEPADILITNARVVDVFSGLVRQDSVAIGDGVFLGFGQREAREVVDAQGAYLLPGFIDAHIHLESSMVTPARFAEMALPHGTTSVVADPHELGQRMRHCRLALLACQRPDPALEHFSGPAFMRSGHAI